MSNESEEQQLLPVTMDESNPNPAPKKKTARRGRPPRKQASKENIVHDEPKPSESAADSSDKTDVRKADASSAGHSSQESVGLSEPQRGAGEHSSGERRPAHRKPERRSEETGDAMDEDFRVGRPSKEDDFEVRFEGVPVEKYRNYGEDDEDDKSDDRDARTEEDSRGEGKSDSDGESREENTSENTSTQSSGDASPQRDGRERFERGRQKFQKKKDFQRGQPGNKFDGNNNNNNNKFGKNKHNKPNHKGPNRDPNFQGHPNAPQNRPQKQARKFAKNTVVLQDGGETEAQGLELGELQNWDVLKDIEEIDAIANELAGVDQALQFNRIYRLPLPELKEEAQSTGIHFSHSPSRSQVLRALMEHTVESRSLILIEGLLEILEDGNGLLTYPEDNYRIKEQAAFVSSALIKRYGLQRGHFVKTLSNPPRAAESAPYTLRILEVNGMEPEAIARLTPFTELVPYYPTERIMMEREDAPKADAVSMRVVDLLTPIGLGQRGLIVAPPRTGKTVLMQGIANSIAQNKPNAKLIILLIDERPEEVTDFRRNCPGEVIASTFDETPDSHVHAAEMVIEKARRMVEAGDDVIILLDSITRLARAYNALMPSSGKILSGGVEANALQKPKRFFGSARNIEDGGSLTILGTALVETGSRMDEVIFEEFKGTGNMELHLDRALVDKRIFPSLSFERCGTRKEELLYHPDEMLKVYGLRRAMKGVPSTEAMEMLITRVKKTKTNAEFLMTLSR